MSKCFHSSNHIRVVHTIVLLFYLNILSFPLKKKQQTLEDIFFPKYINCNMYSGTILRFSESLEGLIDLNNAIKLMVSVVQQKRNRLKLSTGKGIHSRVHERLGASF